MLFDLIFLLILIILSGFFSGSEVALVGIRESKVKTLLKEKRRGINSLNRLKHHPKRMLITILIGNNVVNIAASSLVAVLITNRFGSIGLGIATGLMTIIILIAGEIIPKTFASSHTVRVALIVAPIIEAISFILYPIVWILDKIAIFVNNLVKIRQSDKYNESEVMSVLDIAYEQKVLDKNIKKIMEKSLKFGKVSVEDIMIPIEEVFVLDATNTIKDTVDTIIDRGYSRIPVYKNHTDNVIGVVLIKDILREIKNENEKIILEKIAIEPPFISPLTHADNLLNFFQKKHIHFGLVKEGHKIKGIVTIEDILEEIVGEITDESDITPQKFLIVNQSQIVAHPETRLKKIDDFFDTKNFIKIKEKSVKDFVKENLDDISINSKITKERVEFKIRDLDKNKRLKLIQITNKADDDYLTNAVRQYIPQKNLIKYQSK